MSLTCGFFNSSNGDRKYDTTQLSSLFDGIIRDGVFASIGSAMAVTADSGLTVKVGTGRAWFNHTWTLNDAILPITLEISELLLNRIDAIVLEINHSENMRINSIKVIKGTPASVPQNPAMENTDLVHQYPLCYIYRAANSSEITQADITNAVGTEECPFVTGILSVVSIDAFISQWRAEFDRWMDLEQDNYTEWLNTAKAALQTSMDDFDRWMSDEQAEFYDWFNNVKGTLSGDVAASLTSQLSEHVNNKNNPHAITPSGIGAAPSSHGNHVPTTEQAKNSRFLRNDNTWQDVTPDNIGAAKSSHGTHVSFSTTNPVMDGTASVGSASTVARSDHKHPTDTSRAPAYSYGTNDLTAGTSKLDTGKLHFVYE